MKNTLLIAGSVAGLVLFGAGCPSSASPRESAQTPSAPVAMHGGNCDNAYYPLKKGIKATYATHFPGHDSTYSWEVTDATDDSATLTYTFSPTLHVTSEISCTGDGLQAKTYMDLGSAMSGGKVSAKTTSASGSIFPKDVHPGSVWTSRYEVETENNMPAAAKLGMKTGHMVVSTTSTAMGEESVTVPAGTFTALKVEAKMLIHMSLGANMPSIDTQTTSVSYFVKGKGLVKTETTDSRGGTSGMEATSIVIP